jgi:hypothetical protein
LPEEQHIAGQRRQIEVRRARGHNRGTQPKTVSRQRSKKRRPAQARRAVRLKIGADMADNDIIDHEDALAC